MTDVEIVTESARQFHANLAPILPARVGKIPRITSHALNTVSSDRLVALKFQGLPRVQGVAGGYINIGMGYVNARAGWESHQYPSFCCIRI